MNFEEVANKLKDYSIENFTEAKLLEKADQGRIDVTNQLMDIAKINNIRQIILALDSLKSDLMCITKQELISKDETYLSLSNDVFSFYKKPN